jgi:hypothetical protein
MKKECRHARHKRKIPVLLIPFAEYFEEIFQLLSGAVLLFSEDKMSNNIETRSIFKKTLFYKLV